MAHKSLMPAAPASPQEHAGSPLLSGSRWSRLWGCGLLLAMPLVVYLPALNGGLIWDDDVNITTNLTLRSASGLAQMWFVPQSTQQYYPLTYTTHWIEYQLWGTAPFGYHLVNVLLHGIDALLVWRLLAALRVPGAWLAAALFAVHPLEVESVAWITERKNVLSLAFALLSMLCYLRFAPPDEKPADSATRSGRWPWYALSLVLFAAALFSKTVVVTLPAVLLVITWWKRGRLTGRDVAPLAPFFVLGFVLGLVTVQMERAEGADWTLGPGGRVLLAGRATWFYAGKFAWPHPLMFFYPRWDVDLYQWRQDLFPLAALALIVALWAARDRIGRGPLAAVLLFVGVLAPVLGFLTIHYMRHTYVADHFQYHASVVLAALAGAGAAGLATHFQSQRHNPVYIAAGVVLVVAASLSWQRAHYYRDPEVLFRDTIARNPQSATARSNLGGYLHTLGRYEEALRLARDGVDIEPQDAGVHNNLGAALLALGNRDGFAPGQLEEIFAELNRALELNPSLDDAHANLAFALLTAQRPAEALPHFEEALAINPSNARARYGLGTILGSMGKRQEAVESFQRSLELNPGSAETHYGLALVLRDEGRAEEAVRHLDTSLAIDPQLAEAHYAWGVILASQDDLRGAAHHFAAAVQARPSYAQALNNLGVVQMNLGETEQAIGNFQEAVRQKPDYSEAQANLQRAEEFKRQSQAEKSE